MRIVDIYGLRKNDIIQYSNGKKNIVNKPWKYKEYYLRGFLHYLDARLDIVKVERPIKILGITFLKTIYKGEKSRIWK